MLAKGAVVLASLIFFAIHETSAQQDQAVVSQKLRISPTTGMLEIVASPVSSSSPEIIARKDAAAITPAFARPRSHGDLERRDRVAKAIAAWPRAAHLAAISTMDKYGVPNRIRHGLLAWIGNGEWNRTIVYRYGTRYSKPNDNGRALEQTISYDIPPDKIIVLEGLDIGLRTASGGKELSAISQSEDTNYLAINLAHSVINGLLSAAQAKAIYNSTISYSNAGSPSPYMDGLLFTPMHKGR